MLEQFFLASLIVQLFHSVEELSTGFHRKWYLFKMPFWVFLSFEIIFTAFWLLVLFTPTFPYRETLQGFFLVLMLANGIQHIIWSGVVKKYAPGLVTAPLHVLVFVVYYFQII